MRLIRAETRHKCKKCGCDIWCGSKYYPQCRGEAICDKCGDPKNKSFFKWLFEYLIWSWKNGSS